MCHLRCWMSLWIIVGMVFVSACYEEESQNSGPQEEKLATCHLEDYATLGDMIYRICHYIERCDKTIYAQYHNDIYPMGYVDQCFCNVYMNEQLDDSHANPSRKEAYLSFVMLSEAWEGECSEHATGTLKAKLKYFFE